MTSKKAKTTLHATADPVKAQAAQKYFKTARGQYGYGDIFIGVNVPTVRKVAKQFEALPLSQSMQLLKSKVHEVRLLALFILCSQYKKGSPDVRNKISRLYSKNLSYVNNWDLVDTSAPLLMGAHLNGKSKLPLYGLAKSKRLWDRRVAVLATFYEIQNNRFKDALKISEQLLNDSEDLMHKAVGWMLREIGKRDLMVLELFLKKHHRTMPRTMLRYAVEKFPEKKRQAYLIGLE